MIVQSNYLHEVLSGEFAESEPKDFSEPVDEGEQAEDYGYYSDSDLEDDVDVENAKWESKKTIRPKDNPPYPIPSATDCKDLGPTYGEWKELSVKGTVIKIHDIAFITCVSLNIYRYTANEFVDSRHS